MRDKMARQAASGSNSNPRNTLGIPGYPDENREGYNFPLPPQDLGIFDLTLNKIEHFSKVSGPIIGEIPYVQICYINMLDQGCFGV
jgi:hypothetical protein